MLESRRRDIALESRVSCRLYGGLVGLVSGGGIRRAGLTGWDSSRSLLLAGHGRVYRYAVSREQAGSRSKHCVIPVSSLKAAGFSWSMEASMSMGVRHFWQNSPCDFLSVAIVVVRAVPHSGDCFANVCARGELMFKKVRVKAAHDR